MTPGSVFKTVTLPAALEQLPDLFQRTFTCTGSTVVGGETITCPFAHGEMDINDAFASSCNGVFAQLADELGAETIAQYAKQAGLLDRYSVSGISTAAGSVALEGATSAQLGWAGVGQYHDLVNPCALMIYMGAIANGGKAAVPTLIQKVESPGLPSLPQFTRKTKTLISSDTADKVSEMMMNNVQAAYGTKRFPNMELGAKSGTAEHEGKTADAMFAGFCVDENCPLAFVVFVENGGSGSAVAAPIAAKVLQVCAAAINR